VQPTTVGRVVPGHLGLTAREQDVAELAVSGFSYAQIARDLFVAQSTVGYHLSNIYAKCGVSSRHELTALVRSAELSAGRRY
jgi:DNA-binding CsgD family transcriptional regulator